MGKRWTRFAVVVLATCALSAGTVRAQESVERRVEQILKTPGFENGQWGLLVVDARTGESVFEKNADQLFCPASVTKLYSVAAAITELGDDYRFVTPLRSTGNVGEDGVLRGDLILVASGDPSLGGRTGPDGSLLFVDEDHSYAGGNLTSSIVDADPLAGLDFLASKVQASGIKVVQGDVIIDDRLFDSAPSSGSGPSQVGPILVNDNVIDVLVTPGKAPGELATLRTVPETSFVVIDSLVSTGSQGVKPGVVVEPVGPRRFAVRGQLPVGHPEVLKIYEIEEPSSFARTLLIECLRRHGIRVNASPLGRNAPEKLASREEVARLPVVAEYTSPPFRETVKIILKVSQNLHASLLPLLLAAKHDERTLAAGLLREAEALKGLGVPVESISLGSGAGGSRSDLVTPRATVALLRIISNQSEFPAFESALPVLGRDGTLSRHAPADSQAKGHVRAKTGTYWVDNSLGGHPVLTSKALAGYMDTASGRRLVFTFFVNNILIDGESEQGKVTPTAAGKVLAQLCEVFYADQQTPPPESEPAAGNTTSGH